MILLYLYEYFGEGEAVSSSPPPLGLCLCKSERKRVKTLLVIGEEKRLRIVHVHTIRQGRKERYVMYNKYMMYTPFYNYILVIICPI